MEDRGGGGLKDREVEEGERNGSGGEWMDAEMYDDGNWGK